MTKKTLKARLTAKLAKPLACFTAGKAIREERLAKGKQPARVEVAGIATKPAARSTRAFSWLARLIRRKRVGSKEEGLIEEAQSSRVRVTIPAITTYTCPHHQSPPPPTHPHDHSPPPTQVPALQLSMVESMELEADLATARFLSCTTSPGGSGQPTARYFTPRDPAGPSCSWEQFSPAQAVMDLLEDVPQQEAEDQGVDPSEVTPEVEVILPPPAYPTSLYNRIVWPRLEDLPPVDTDEEEEVVVALEGRLEAAAAD